MKTILLTVAVMAVFILGCSQPARIYVVDQKNPTADDAGLGTTEEPFKTIGAAVNLVKAGEKILIQSGIYREGIELKTSGTRRHPIVIEAANLKEVIMRGSVPVTGWTRNSVKDSVYIYNGWDKYFGPANKPPNAANGGARRAGDARTKPRNQLFAGGEYIEEVFISDSLKENSFFIDKENKRIHLWLLKGENPNNKEVEVSDREFLFNTKGNSYVTVKGVRFERGSNPLGDHAHSDALVRILGGHDIIIEDCDVEWASAEGLRLEGTKIVLRRCSFDHCGESGFNAYYTVDCLVEDCEYSYNNTHPNKTFSPDWGAAGSKHCFNYRLVFDRNYAHHNNGPGIWLDISNNKCEIKNSLCTDNNGAGIFYEISFALHAHDNVMFNNGLNARPGAWGANGGISLSESPGCVIERNILIGNVEGFQFRDQSRNTVSPVNETIRNISVADVLKGEVAIWNHDEIIRKNIMAYNVRGQLKGWVNRNGRMLPAAMQKSLPGAKPAQPREDMSKDYQARDENGQPIGLSLEKLNVKIDNNIYWGDSYPDLILWGDKLKYQSLDKATADLKFEEHGKVIDPQFADWKTLDLRVPADSPLLKMGCYPKGEIPGVKLGVIRK